MPNPLPEHDPCWTGRRLLRARCALDATGTSLGSAEALGVALVLERTPAGRLFVRDAGPSAPVAARWPGLLAHALDRPGALIIPGLVNAHTHLDLSHIGPRPHDPREGFAGWVAMIRRERHAQPQQIARSVQQGVALALRGATAVIGDIAGAVAGRPSALAASALRDALARSGQTGTSFIELFAMGARWPIAVQGAIDALAQVGPGTPGHRAGLQPHAPYSVHPLAYQRLHTLGVPLMTHLAESPDEAQLVARATGPLRTLLEEVGVWDELTNQTFGHGRTPVAHLAQQAHGGVLRPGLAAVHLNQLTDEDLDALARSGCVAVYCPRASAYFGAHQAFGPHRYQDLLRAGVPVALGTDSVVNIPAADLDARGLCVWDELRLLRTRDGAPALDLLAGATVHGLRALGLPPAAGTVVPNQESSAVPVAGITAVYPSGRHDSAVHALELSLETGSRLELLALGCVQNSDENAQIAAR